jgi:hypothetical protein
MTFRVARQIQGHGIGRWANRDASSTSQRTEVKLELLAAIVSGSPAFHPVEPSSISTDSDEDVEAVLGPVARCPKTFG